MTLIAGHEDGEICHYDMKTNKKSYSNRDHTKAISDLQLSQDGLSFPLVATWKSILCRNYSFVVSDLRFAASISGTMLISSSKDFTAKLFDAKLLEPLKVYEKRL